MTSGAGPCQRCRVADHSFRSESLPATYCQALGRDELVPEDGYHGAYMFEMGKKFVGTYGEQFLNETAVSHSRDRATGYSSRTGPAARDACQKWTSTLTSGFPNVLCMKRGERLPRYSRHSRTRA